MRKIGARNVKTALAVTISYMIVYLLTGESSIFASIAAIITMQNSVYSSFKAGKNRMIGTTIGAMAAIAASTLSVNIYIKFFMLFVGTISVIYFCNLLRFKQSVSIACIVFAIITTSAGSIAPLEYGIRRLFETFLGIIVAWIINYMVSPNEQSHKLDENYVGILKKADDIFISILRNKDNPKMDTLRDSITDYKSMVDSFHFGHDDERFRDEWEDRIDKVRKLREVNVHLKLLHEMRERCCISTKNLEKLNDMGYEIELDTCTFMPMDEHEDIVFNFHIDKMLKLKKEL